MITVIFNNVHGGENNPFPRKLCHGLEPIRKTPKFEAKMFEHMV